jgi:hypothetical protein
MEDRHDSCESLRFSSSFVTIDFKVSEEDLKESDESLGGSKAGRDTAVGVEEARLGVAIIGEL